MRSYLGDLPYGYQRLVIMPYIPWTSHARTGQPMPKSLRALSDGRVVVSKDSDFIENYLLTGMPRILLI